MSHTLSGTQLSDLPFSPPSVPPPSGFPNALSLSFDSLRFSPFTLPGFPCSPSGSAYSALCLFPFIQSCFAPTAAPQALTIDLQLCFPLPSLSFVHSGLGSDYSASASSFPFFLNSPHSGSLSAIIHPNSCLFPYNLPDFGTQLCCNPFLHTSLASQRLQLMSSIALSVSKLYFRIFPIALALGSE